MDDGSDGYETGFEEYVDESGGCCPDCGKKLSNEEWVSGDGCPYCGDDLRPF